MSKKIIFFDEQIKEILYLYTVQHISIAIISKSYQVDPSVIKRVLKENSIEIRDNNAYKAKAVDSNFFEKIDSQEKAYILGFIYADGCVSNHRLSIKISKQDIELLEQIKLSMSSSHKIGVYTNHNGYGKGKEFCQLVIKDNKIENDLQQLGVVPQKTKILTFPSPEQIPPNYIRHFIRGFFDGDGSIYMGNSSPIISFTGTQDMLLGIRQELQKIINTHANVYKYKNKEIFDYKVGGMKQIKIIYDYFYQNANIFLGRKKNKFEEILKF